MTHSIAKMLKTSNRSLTLISECWGNIQNAGPSGSVENFEEFFLEIAIGDVPKKMAYIMFSAEYFPLYWHMPFKISFIL